MAKMKAVKRRPFLSSDQKAVLSRLKIELDDLLHQDLRRVVLFGSRARGDAEADSDLDVAIIVNDLTRKRKRQILDVVTDLELRYLAPVSTFILSSEDFERLRSRERRIARDIEQEGIAI